MGNGKGQPRITLNLNAKALGDVIEANPEVELQIARGTVAILASRVAKKIMNSSEVGVVIGRAEKEALKLVRTMFKKVGGTRYAPEVRLTDRQKTGILEDAQDQIRKLVSEQLSEATIKQIVKEEVAFYARGCIDKYLDSYIKNQLKTVVKDQVKKTLRDSLGV